MSMIYIYLIDDFVEILIFRFSSMFIENLSMSAFILHKESFLPLMSKTDDSVFQDIIIFISKLLSEVIFICHAIVKPTLK